MQFEYGDSIKLDTTALPAASIEALLKRGLNHVFGNEVASKVSTKKKKFSTDNNGAEMADDEVAALTAEARAAALKAVLEGTLGTATRGPAVSPLEAEMDRIAWGEIADILKANGSKAEGKGEERVWKFANGQAFTKDELIERRLSNPEHGDRIRKDAEKALKAKAKKAAGAKVEGDPLAAI